MDSDIRELLTQWAGPLGACDLIFLHAPETPTHGHFSGRGKQAGRWTGLMRDCGQCRFRRGARRFRS